MIRNSALPVALSALTFLVPVCRAANEPVTCVTCHRQQRTDLDASAHSMLKCQECHQGKNVFEVAAEELGEYVRAVTTGSSSPKFDHGPSFTGKATRGQVPALCGDCHADVERMNPYGIRTDQLARYWTSGHGKSLAQNGEERVAVCIDCHGVHDILSAREPSSKTHPLNVPHTCGTCHADRELMSEFDLPVEVTEEYRQSVHGRLLFERQDTGAPTCATCHGSHSSPPPGFATVGAVCAKCHEHASRAFATSIHATMPEHKGCVQCHGGGEGRHFHLIERITKPTGLLIQRYARLLASEPEQTAERIAEAIHPDPRQIIEHALPTCLECHEEIEEDESLPKMFDLLDAIAEAERSYVETGRRLEEVARGVLLVDRQRFLFEEAKTHLIELAPLQHTLDNKKVADKIAELNKVCDRVRSELEGLEGGLRMRYLALIPMWAFAVVFSAILYVKHKQLRRTWVRP